MQRYASLIGWLGGVAILFGLLSLLLQIFSGTQMLGADLWWILGNFLVGAVLLTIALVSSLDSCASACARMKPGARASTAPARCSPPPWASHSW